MSMAAEDPDNSAARHVAASFEPRTSERTCVGCGAKDAPEALLRLVQASKESVVVDAAASSFGRGAHLHPRPDCLARACKGGLAKAFKSPIKADVATLANEIVEALERRVDGLISAARRSGAAAVGADSAIEAALRGAPLLIVACDAGSIADKHVVTDAIAEGRAVAWGTKSRNGAALMAITGASIAAEILRATSAASGVDACRKSREVR